MRKLPLIGDFGVIDLEPHFGVNTAEPARLKVGFVGPSVLLTVELSGRTAFEITLTPSDAHTLVERLTEVAESLQQPQP